MAVLGLHSFCALGHVFSGLLRCTRNFFLLRVMCFPFLVFFFFFSFLFFLFILCSHLFYSFAFWVVSTFYVLAYDGTLI